jgi:predicted Ser/Thr protein kinase
MVSTSTSISKKCEIQTKSFELGIAPQVYSFNIDTVIMEYIKGLTLREYKKTEIVGV